MAASPEQSQHRRSLPASSRRRNINHDTGVTRPVINAPNQLQISPFRESPTGVHSLPALGWSSEFPSWEGVSLHSSTRLSVSISSAEVRCRHRAEGGVGAARPLDGAEWTESDGRAAFESWDAPRRRRHHDNVVKLREFYFKHFTFRFSFLTIDHLVKHLSLQALLKFDRLFILKYQ